MTTTIRQQPSVAIHLTHTYVTPTDNSRCEQITSDATGETPLWVTYDPEHIQAIAVLRPANKTARYSLGCAGYTHQRSLGSSEIWTRPTNLDPASCLTRGAP